MGDSSVTGVVPRDLLPGGKRQIHLVGFMGCGKSTVGRHLARRLVWNFLDLDALIQRHAGQSVETLFAERGEGGFRQVEAWVLRQAVQKPACVVALGGGTFLAPENRDLCDRVAAVVWLRCSFDTALQRVEASGQNRPLWSDRDAARRLFQARQASYRQAHYQVDAEPDPVRVATAIQRLLPGSSERTDPGESQ